MAKLAMLNGKTKLIGIVGDPIAQVKSPAGMTAGLMERGINAVVVPFHVSPGGLAAFMAGLALAGNVSGMIMTVPHKVASFGLCASTSARAQRLRAVNTLRRRADGGWHGDMFDGEGFVAAQREAGLDPVAKRVLVAGAGGAGSAIALAFLEAGAGQVAVHDGDAARRDALLGLLAPVAGGRVAAGSADPAGFDVIVNATPAGMKPGDAPPVDVTRLRAEMFVGDVITVPEETALLRAARGLGCATQSGVGMFNAVRELMLEFYTAGLQG